MTIFRQIGLVPMSAKPFHIGHAKLIELALETCEHVHVFVSLSDRNIVSGCDMEHIWMKEIIPHYDQNVSISFSKMSPVRDVYEFLGVADKEEVSDSMFNIYSDVEDVYRNFPLDKLQKYMPYLTKNVRILRCGVSRDTTVQISGEMMRDFLRLGLKNDFCSYLPSWMNAESVWSQLFKG